MSCFQRIFHVHTKRADFPICLEVAFGPQPRESQGAWRHSEECPHHRSCSQRGGTPAPHLQRPLPPDGAAPLSAPGHLLVFVGLALLRRPTSAALATSDSRSPPPRPAVPAPHREPAWIVVVCLCLLKLGWEKRPRSQDGLECTPEHPTDGSVSKLRKQAARAGTRPRSGAAWLAREHAVREGKPRGCRQDRGLFCAEAVLQREALVPLAGEKIK